jgi:hypothetical protein
VYLSLHTSLISLVGALSLHREIVAIANERLINDAMNGKGRRHSVHWNELQKEKKVPSS